MDLKNITNNRIIDKTKFIYLFFLIPTLIIFSKFITEFIILCLNVYILFNINKSIININNFRKQNKENLKIFLIFLLFFIYIILNSIINFVTFSEPIKAISLLRFAILLLLPTLITKNINKNSLFLFIVIITLIFNIDIIYQYINDKNILGYKYNEEYSRYAGLFKNELIAGSYLFFIFFLLLFLYFFSDYKKFLILLMFITYICIYISGDRSPFLSLNLGLFILIFLYFKSIIKFIKKNKIIFLILSFCIIFFISQNKINLLTKKYQNIIEYTKKVDVDVKNIDYYYHYSKAYLIFKSHFFFGSGYKSFRHECSNPIYNDIEKQLLDKRHFNGCTTHPHNFYLELLSDLGIFGFLIFIFVLFNLVKICFLKIKNNSEKNNQYKILLTFLISYFFPFKPTGSVYTNFSLIMFFFVIIFFIIITKNYSSKNE